MWKRSDKTATIIQGVMSSVAAKERNVTSLNLFVKANRVFVDRLNLIPLHNIHSELDAAVRKNA